MIQRPKGTLDLYGSDGNVFIKIREYICSFMTLYNYEYAKIPTFESSDLFIRSIGEETDVVNKETYNFTDKSDRKMTLRPEFTAGIVRMIIENKLYTREVNKFYYFGSAFRYERPQNGRLREFTQAGVEVFGVKNPYIDAEVISIAYKLLTNIGLNNLSVKINTLGDTESRKNYKEALKEYLKDKVDSLCDDCKVRYEKNILRILDCKVDSENEILKNVPKPIEYLSDDSIIYYENLKKALEVLEVPYEEDGSLVRGLDYYTDTVFEIVYNKEGLGTASTVCGGGRYDNLVNSLGNKDIPAFGFALGIERLMILLKEEGSTFGSDRIDAYVMNLGVDKYAYEVVDMLRSAGFVTETDYLNKSMKAQFKIIDDINPSYIIIAGEDEEKGNYLTVKDNATKESEKVEFDDLMDYLNMNI